MNYQHLYHAGNFADVFKHMALIFSLEKLHEKDTPFFVMDTHAGRGKYDLSSSEATKTGEALLGVQNFLQNTTNSDLTKNYFRILSKINAEKLTLPLRFYPGSPYIIKNFLRPQDRAIFAEIRREEFLQLKRNFAGNKQVTYLNEDGFELLKSKLPPLERRGLILIDPAYEKGSEALSKDYDKIIIALKDGLKRFAHGIYLVWYPIINKENEEKILQNFYREMHNLKTEKIANFIFSDDKNKNSTKMNACGIFAINPVWGLEEKLKNIFGDKLTIK